MKPSITLDSTNNVITLSAGGQSIVMGPGYMRVPKQMDEMITLRRVLVGIVVESTFTAILLVYCAIIFGGLTVPEIKKLCKEGYDASKK